MSKTKQWHRYGKSRKKRKWCCIYLLLSDLGLQNLILKRDARRTRAVKGAVSWAVCWAVCFLLRCWQTHFSCANGAAWLQSPTALALRRVLAQQDSCLYASLRLTLKGSSSDISTRQYITLNYSPHCVQINWEECFFPLVTYLCVPIFPRLFTIPPGFRDFAIAEINT